MEPDSNAMLDVQTLEQWNQARRRAFYQRLWRGLGLTRQPVDLLAFDEVQTKLRLNQNAYRGLQQVPLAQIVGSVGRYHDFTRSFLPLVENDKYRWQRIAQLQTQTGLPPIELYKVGEAYFVKDGNHRVSVARQYGAKTIEAYVWEYETPVGGMSADPDLDELIVKAEYRQFLDTTRLDVLRPEQRIVLTEPGRYPDLELEIELYRQNLGQIDGDEYSLENAVTAWYDMVYTLAVDTINESGVLKQFPGRTEADLYAWTSRHRRELADRYGGKVSVRDAVAQIAEGQRRPGPVERIVQSASQAVSDFVQSLTGDRESAPSVPEMPLAPGPVVPLGKLLTQLRDTTPELAYEEQRGDEWRAWRQMLRAKVWDLLGLRYEYAGSVPVEIVDRAVVSGVERTKIWLTAADGLRLPAYVLRPAEVGGLLPALLVYPGHGTIRQTSGLENSRQHANALTLAQAGYLVITVEARGFGQLDQDDHVVLDNVARLMGRTWLGITLDDGLRALDYVQSLPDVDSTRLGVTGLGLGGGMALYTAALDERVRAVVIENYLGGGIDPVIVRGHGCDFVPGLLRYAQLSDIARLIVPRPALYVYPGNFPTTPTARAWFDGMRPSYEGFRCPDRTNFIEHEDGETFRCSDAQAWFNRWLVEEEDTNMLLWEPSA
ncbi:MAG: acetylxylan esterase [Anaerolineae bacterium]|nr:acetylxylan esterase [Anaerolineae bacterium]